MRIQNLRKALFTFASIFIFSLAVRAQFNSGSTGADGAFDTATFCTPAQSCQLQVPESGVFHFTTVNIRQGMSFIRNSRNTPVTILAQGNIVFSGGSLNLRAFNNIPGPGGFYGGGPGRPGFGPGGGISPGSPGAWVGPLDLVPLIGGSGGAGNSSRGGGGGGAILIASSTAITMTSSFILAEGDNNSGGGTGSGGAIRLVANSINVGDAGLGNVFSACGPGGVSTCGVVRLEATNLTFGGTSSPPATLSPINPTVAPPNSQLTISTIGGFQVPSYAGLRFDTIDLLLPNQLPDPVNIVVQATGIPVGTQVNIGFVSGSNSGTSAPCNLAGSFENSACTATVSNLTRTAVTYLLATAAFQPPGSLAKYNPGGPYQVSKIKLEAVLGAKSRYLFFDARDNAIDPAKLKREFLQYFGI